ncbi:MAG TPA: glycosyltransferase, partial [Azospira sp.]|nr:glycosyltransferase [Azospira sp.]
AGERDLVVLCVGRMAPEKNLELALEAFAAIQTRQPTARLVFVGDGPVRAGFQARHPQHIYAGMRRGPELAAHYASADLFLFPSLTETYGNVTLEALASGLPVVAYDYAAAAELVEPGRNGLLAPPGDATAFIAAAGAAAEPNTLRILKNHARMSVMDNDWERIHDAFAGTLSQAVRSHERRQRAETAIVMAPD